MRNQRRKKKISFEDIIRLIEKLFMLLGQNNNKVAYFWHLLFDVLNMVLYLKSDGEIISDTLASLLLKNLFIIIAAYIKHQKEILGKFKENGRTKKNFFL